MSISTSSTIKAWEVSDKLSECFASNPQAPKTRGDEQVRELTRLINRYKEAPVTSKMMHEVGKGSRQDIQERKILDKAAAILRHERDRCRDMPPDSVEHYDVWRRARAADIDAAITTLNAPGFIDFGKPPATRRGRDARAWTVMAARLAEEAIKAMRAAGDRRGTIGRADGPIIRFVHEALKWILEEDEGLPSHETIREALKGRLNI